MTVAATVFLALLGGHLAAALVLNRRGQGDGARGKSTDAVAVFPVRPFVVVLLARVRRRKLSVIALAAVQTVLFGIGCYFANELGYLNRGLVSPLAIGAGLLAGHAIFGISLVLTHQEVGDVASHLIDLRPLWDYIVEHPRVLSQFVTVSVAEEMIYRAGAQPLSIQLTGSAAAGIAAAAVVFAVVHDHFFKNSAGQSAEFLGFSVLLGVLFWLTGSLILVIVIHAVRNIEIAYIEHLAQAEEAGGEPLADCEAEYLAGERSLVVLLGAGGELPAACFQYAEAEGPARPAQPAMESV